MFQLIRNFIEKRRLKNAVQKRLNSTSDLLPERIRKSVETSILADEAGKINNRHFTEYVNEVKTLKRSKKLREAETLLLRLVDATEAQDDIDHFGVAPWYYEQLAIIYREQKDFSSEIAILERYIKQKGGIHSARQSLVTRLEKAKVLRSKS